MIGSEIFVGWLTELNVKKIPRIDPSGKRMIKFINNICENIGPRIGGTKEEKDAGDLIYKEMSLICDSVEQEEFTCHPQGFLDFIWIIVALYFGGIITYIFLHPLISSFLFILGLGIYFVQQLLLWEVVDFLYPKKTSYHIIGKIKPSMEVKKLILISGHHDSAYEFPLLSKLGEKSKFLIFGLVFITVLNILLGVLKTILLFNKLTNLFLIDLIQYFSFVPGIILILILGMFLRSNRGVLGANDNLSAVSAVLEVGKYLVNNLPENVEVWLISFAGEEHMRGSKRFVSLHKEELIERNAFLFNLECLSAETFLLATRETMFLAKHSLPLIQIIEKAAIKLELSVTVKPLTFAGSDAANFSRKGIHATTLFGLSTNGVPMDWHTLQDTPERLNGASIACAAELVLQVIYDLDELAK